MRNKILFIFTAVVLCFISCFGCNTGGESMQTINSGGMQLSIEKGENWLGKMKVFIFSVKKTPQLAAWIENGQGDYVSTITVTGKSARNNWISAPKEGRPEALPVWNHKRQNSIEQFDVLSSATPKTNIDVQINNDSLIKGQDYNVYLEVNHSFDYNDVWTKDNSGVNGQPSLIYHAKFIAGTPSKIRLILIGHGSVDGSDGNIVQELDGMTTALTIINEAYLILN